MIFLADRKIGLKIRKMRILSQMKLAERIGVSFQQVQKYESGANKVSLEKLAKIARALNVPIGYFIVEKEKKTGKKESLVLEKGEGYEGLDFEDLSEDELQLILRFRAIKNTDIKRGVMLLVRGANQMEGV